MNEKEPVGEKKDFMRPLLPSVWDLAKTFFILAAATGIGMIFWNSKFTEANIITIYLLGVLLTSIITKNYGCSVISSLASVLVFNFFFTEPRLTFHAYEAGYPVTFAIMLTASLITGSLANKLTSHAKQSAQAAFRTKILFDTNQLLQKATDDDERIHVAASQLVKLLGRDITACSERNGILSESILFPVNEEKDWVPFFTGEETAAARWAYEHGTRAGAGTKLFGKARCLYLAVCTNDNIYGVVGIHLTEKPLDSFENSVLLSILGECALAIENSRNAKEKEEAAILARNEQLRANLLRTISHDLRTPLTSISGNADNLLSNYDMLDANMRTQIFTDIYEDSQWLISLVENLLSVTRIEEGRMNFNMSLELVSEVIDEALRHVKRKAAGHGLSVSLKDDLMLAKMDAKLIIQVIINLIDNAVKYTPQGSLIRLTAEKKEGVASISVTDNGPGIPDDLKPQVFEMFFTGNTKIADSRRSLGLGLALCRSIVNAHGGEMTLKDERPHGCCFTFTLPLGEVDIYE
ncbi:MAG: DUF4118 domain-containing protein [Lachnospiraceae bacterium]|jgi:two-component system sensor histidine kinase KdpD|nr:DUF4118 domain-containing protein [Lachnospiraceae bacterium]